jgi:hypothetical protein
MNLLKRDPKFIEPPDEPRHHDDSTTVPAAEGAGPLYQRDYVGVIVDAGCTPEEVLRMLREEFPRFSDPQLAEFQREEPADRPLEIGDDMTVYIRAAGYSGVRITHMDARSLTMRTLDDHPEAGRITFGAYYDEQGRLNFRIRSRARAIDALHFIGWQLMGRHIQVQIWKEFVRRVAAGCGGRLLDDVQVETQTIEETPADEGALETPTFVAGRTGIGESV